MADLNIFKLLPTGDDTFAEVINKNKYYVDKTSYLKKVFAEDGSSVLLFTRPRRFGKTLLMDMFSDFFRLNVNNPSDTSFQQKLFNGMEIMNDRAFVDKYMGQFPVISISLKGVIGGDFDIAKGALITLVKNLARTYSFLQKSEALTDDDKFDLKNLCSDSYLKKPINQNNLTDSLSFLSSYLFKHFKKQVIILIDEYDVPLANAANGKYHKQMVDLISSFLGVLKSTPKNTNEETSTILKVVMTGCLKVAKNSIFTGVNNVVVNTVLSTRSEFTTIIGFNKEETKKFLKDYNLSEYESMVKENYDGYRFDDVEMFCPWDVINFVAENYKHVLNHQEYKIKPDNYWNATSSSLLLQEYIGFLKEDIRQHLQDLVDRKTIEVSINDSMNYDDLKLHDPNDFFSLLVHTGYLTAVGNPSKNNYIVKIPNEEILNCFESNIKKVFDDNLTLGPDKKAEKLASGFLEGNTSSVTNILNSLLTSYVSIRDLATKSKPENFYHGFMSGIFTVSEKWVKEYKSNFEAGNGYADISFRNSDKTKVAILELKSSPSEKDMKIVAQKALLQIEEKQYAKEFLELPTVQSIEAYGIAFFNKQSFIISKKIM